MKYEGQVGIPGFELIDAKIDFTTWALCLPRWVMAARSSIGWALRRSFSVRWHGGSMSTTVLPLPVPFPGCFAESGPGLSSRRLTTLAQKRLVHCMVLVLNKMYLGRWASFEELRSLRMQCRCPASRGWTFGVAPGRSGPELIACLAKLEDFVTTQPEFASEYFTGPPMKVSRVSKEVEEEYGKFPQLRPYRSLCVERLKITGRGEWPLADFLDSVLYLPYVEPACLLHGLRVDHLPSPNFEFEDHEEQFQLALKWDSLGLLRLVDAPSRVGFHTRVDNCFKDEKNDRQIGDRRHVNKHEFHLGGPSSRLPNGQLLVSLYCRKWKENLRGSITDRRDFYHQARVSDERAASNVLHGSFPLSRFRGTSAFEDYVKKYEAERFGGHREAVGDKFGKEGWRKKPPLDVESKQICIAFGALFQGDHLGVEFALDGHNDLLRRKGLLIDSERVEGHSIFPYGPVWQALVIDDFFCISAQDKNLPKESTEVFRLLAKARQAYDHHRLLGLVEKDVVAEDIFKAAGCEINASPSAISVGFPNAAAPLAKRLGLGLVSLRAASLPAISTTLAARLSGSWVSVLLYRRCLTSLVDDFFSLASLQEKEEAMRVVPLERKVAEEIVSLAILAPICASDLSAPYLKKIYATDASMSKGAIVSTDIPEDVAKALCLGSDKKGAYVLLDSAPRSILKHVGEFEDDKSDGEEVFEQIEKPPQFRFDFVELCGGAGALSDAMRNLGCVVAPVLDLSDSKKYNLCELQFLNWIFHMLDEGLFESIFCEPPCTSFSAAAHPACRSYRCPEGWNRKLPKVFRGNMLGFRSILVVRHAVRRRRGAGLEQPRLSKMCWLRAWAWLLRLGCEEAVVASCQFGSPHRKEFRLLLHLVDVKKVEKKCPGGHTHLRIEGKYTKQSAIYTPQLSSHLAFHLWEAIKKNRRESYDLRPFVGKESVLANDLLISATWSEERDWFWKRRGHINVLESGALVSLYEELVRKEPESRVNVLLDSQVAKSSQAKGRSSSFALQPLLKRSAALQLVGGLYAGLNFAPTKLNIADDPTRGRALREPSLRSLLEVVPIDLLRILHAMPTSRVGALWLRLTLFLIFLPPAEGFSVDLALQPFWISLWNFFAFLLDFVYRRLGFIMLSSSVVAPLGLVLGIALLCLSLIAGGLKPLKLVRHQGLFLLVLLSCTVLVRAPMAPETTAELDRAKGRGKTCLPTDRLVRQQTRSNREILLKRFQDWLTSEHDVDWEKLFSKPLDAEAISSWLVAYGRDLYSAGKAYGRFSESINAVATYRPSLRRQLTAAWDLAFAWVLDEPHSHHPALPASFLLGMISVCLVWGWKVEGALFGLMWAGTLRVGEALNAKRKDLILPSDAAPGTRGILLRITMPKTRGRSAKHQSAKIDPEDLCRLISSVFSQYDPEQKLWHLSAATLRRRFNDVLKALEIPTKPIDGARPYDLASFRPGGATWLLGRTEDSELVRRRGRWLSVRVMDIYLQEVQVATSLQKLSERSREKIDHFSRTFPQILETSLNFMKWHIPSNAWFPLFQHQD